MREINYEDIVLKTSQLCIEMATITTEDIDKAYNRAKNNETSFVAKSIMQDLEENARLAEAQGLPICQDTGTAVVFLDLGVNVALNKGFVYNAIQEGVAMGYKRGYLRKSIVYHPIDRENTKDNTPAIIHTTLFDDDRFKVNILLKGGGSENMSTLKMLTPSAGWLGFVDFVLDTVSKAGPNACPPMIIGACLGGNYETCAIQAKHSLLRSIGERNTDPDLASKEIFLLNEINKLNIGPQGLGGKTSAFDVHLSFLPCHIASMPAAVNINCHVGRHGEFIL